MDKDEISPAPSGSARRRSAKLYNERLKALATFLNGIGIALFVAVAITLPAADPSAINVVAGFLAAVMLHIVGQVVLSRWRSEE